LLEQRGAYENYGIFPPRLIDDYARVLRAHNDKDLSEKLFGHADALADVVKKYIHCG